MGTTIKSKHAWASSELSPQQWLDLRDRSMRAAVRCGGSKQPDDDVQEALLRTFEAESRGISVKDYQKYVPSVGIKVARSEQRRLRVAAKHSPLLEEHPGLWCADEPPLPEEQYNQSVPGLREIAREIWSCLTVCDCKKQLFEYLFSEIVLFDYIPPFRESARGETLVANSRTSPTQGRCGSNDAALYRRTMREPIKRLMNDLRRRGITRQDLFTALRTPAAILSSPGLTLMMASSAAGILQRLQASTKKCRLDILYRTGIDRQDLYEAKLPLFAMNLDDAYATARMTREYSIIGTCVYLEKLLKIEHHYENIIDLNYVESLAMKIILDRLKIDPVDRWLGIVALGALYKQEGVSIDYIEKKLSPIEHIGKSHPIQKFGIAFTWLNAVNSDKQRMLREKVYPMLDPEHSPGGLSQLPITIMGSYVGSSPEIINHVLTSAEIWLPILSGLQSKSYLANLGALSQIRHMPHHKPPYSLRNDVKAALQKATTSPIKLIVERSKLVPHDYTNEAG